MTLQEQIDTQCPGRTLAPTPIPRPIRFDPTATVSLRSLLSASTNGHPLRQMDTVQLPPPPLPATTTAAVNGLQLILQDVLDLIDDDLEF